MSIRNSRVSKISEKMDKDATTYMDYALEYLLSKQKIKCDVMDWLLNLCSATEIKINYTVNWIASDVLEIEYYPDDDLTGNLYVIRLGFNHFDTRLSTDRDYDRAMKGL
jgi:hypothetical protein